MRANRFDFLRLVFASTVFVYHLVTLAALDVRGIWELHLADLAEISIQGFFVISGALVYGSWER
ncbi:MAG: acyltransferase, partial [Pseudomonadota bacterium]